MTNIKLPLQKQLKSSLNASSSTVVPNQIQSLEFDARSTVDGIPKSQTNFLNKPDKSRKLALPISDVKKFSLPLRDIIIRASDDFALSIFDNGYKNLVYAGPQSNIDLIEVSPIFTGGSKVFGDVFPKKSEIYNGSISRLWQNVEEFYDFLVENQFYLGFLIFLFNELLTNLTYQSFLLTMSVVSVVEEAPIYTDRLVRQYHRLVKIFTHSHLRGMWWLNVSTDIKILLKKLTRIAKSIWNIVSKFYLVSLLVICVGFLQNATPKITQVSASGAGPAIARQSFLEKYLTMNSVGLPTTNQFDYENSSNTGYSAFLTPSEEIDESSLPASCIIQYKVKDGDTLEQLSVLYNVSIETITNNNEIDSAGLKIDQALQIPCTDAIIYTIKAGDTLESVANRYKLDVITISSLNSESIGKDGFKEGNQILIPGISFEDYNQINNDIAQKEAKTSAEAKALKAQKEKLDKQLQDNKKLISDAKNRAEENNVNLEASSCGLIWPTTTKNISQYPSKSHMALDIANRSKPDIFAAANGKVVYAGWDNTGYGNMLLIDHGNGIKTRYAHNTQLYVSVGDYVTQGQSIAQMGATGRVYGATGIHLHYEVIQNGKLTNPLSCY